MEKTLTVELHLDGCWHRAAEVRVRGRSGSRSEPTSFEYDIDYAAEHLGARGSEAVSVDLPPDFALRQFSSFPAFLVDLMPQGEARRLCEARIRRASGTPTDWTVLRHGAGSPVGNLRIARAAHRPDPGAVGLPRAEVVRRGDAFRAWALSQSVPMRGATDTGGAAPKLLLAEDRDGLLHADGVLPDDRAARHWLVKFPRGRTTRDHQVLAAEAPFLEVARRLGLRCGAALEYEPSVLFVPRFDREVVGEGVVRHGLESVYSLLGVIEAGSRLAWEDVCGAVAGAVDEPAGAVTEIVLRDALALALGDTDNHGRNTALRKLPGRVELSPLFDFAPMFLDPEQIRRSTRWGSERSAPTPDWRQVIDAVSDWLRADELADHLLDLARRLPGVSGWLLELGVEREVVDLITPRIESARASLQSLED